MLGMCCRVQFDRRELGVELVKDVDVMPIDPTDNLPSIFAPMMVRMSKLLCLVMLACGIWQESSPNLCCMAYLCTTNNEHVQRCQRYCAREGLC